MFILTTEKKYQKLFLAGLINGIGDRVSQVATLSLILQLADSGMSVGITLALRMLPFLLFGPFSNKIAAIWSRKNLLIFIDAARAVIAISFFFVENKADIWIIYAASFLLASGEALYAPVRKASIPAIIAPKNLKGVNGLEQVQLGFVLVIGALAGGIVSYLFGIHAAFLVNIVSFIVAGAFINRIESLETPQSKAVSPFESKETGLFSVLFSSSLFIMLLSADILVPLANGIENVLISVYADSTFFAGELGVGILYSVLGTGFIISPLLTKYIKNHFLFFAYLSMLMEGFILLAVSQTGSFMIIAVLFGLLTIFGGVGNTLLDTVIMNELPSKHQGAYFSFSATIGNTSLGLSMFATGLLLDVLQPRILGAINGLLYIAFGGVYLLWSFQLIRLKRLQKGKLL
ncbi:MFS transporter [Niallia circulans]|uniref:MFS transporter n=1 Tax=Niallia circulans TaxID=1397 RepID=A0A553SF14_NIACI|nr:MFS transporter [Niallia circulans]TRZ35588.1 MFS transporter [Niallia circulans]